MDRTIIPADEVVRVVFARKLRLPRNFGERNVQRAETFLGDHRTAWRGATFYPDKGLDNLTDLPLFKVVGERVARNFDPCLGRFACACSWRVERWGHGRS